DVRRRRLPGPQSPNLVELGGKELHHRLSCPPKPQTNVAAQRKAQQSDSLSRDPRRGLDVGDDIAHRLDPGIEIGRYLGKSRGPRDGPRLCKIAWDESDEALARKFRCVLTDQCRPGFSHPVGSMSEHNRSVLESRAMEDLRANCRSVTIDIHQI